MNYTTNKKFPQVGNVYYFHNEGFQFFLKKGSTYKVPPHPHVITEIVDGVCELVPMTSQGDVMHEKNVYHFLPAEACSMLSKPSWVLPQVKSLFIHVEDLIGKKTGMMNPVALEMIKKYIHFYTSYLKEEFPELFIKLDGVKYFFSDKKHFDITTADVFNDLGLQNKSLIQCLKEVDSCPKKIIFSH